MTEHLAYELEPSWPPGAWLAFAKPGDGSLAVRHGASVVTRPEWFGEIVWNGAYADAAFDQTDLVYGSGCRLRDGRANFVASASSMDRIVVLRSPDGIRVSNSLACLLAERGAAIAPLCRRYRQDFRSIIQGLGRYQRTLETSAGEVELVYHDNVRLGPSGIEIVAKPSPQRDFDSFDAYRMFFVSSLQKIAENMRSADRPDRYEWLGTISSGFDSPAVSALGREAGLREVLTFTTARGGGDDDGSRLAERLGLECHDLPRDAWESIALAEAPFLASDAKGEDVYFASAKPLLRKRVLLTGYAARSWSAKTTANRDLCRADQSGLSLTEYRLWSDFIHLPLPPMGERSVTDEEARAIASDLDEWRSGRSYDKPFCRRVLRECGVPDEMYGQEKRAASVLVFDRRSLLSPASLTDYREHLGRARKAAPLRALNAKARDLAVISIRMLAGAVRGFARLAGTRLPIKQLHRLTGSSRLAELAHYEPLSDYLYPWALGHAMRRYRAGSTQTAEEPVQQAEGGDA